MHKVFVSSTWVDLKSERQLIVNALCKMDAFSFVGMEFFGSRDLPPKEASESEVDKCDLYVCIVGNRYGSGITEKEYDRARRLNLPCFIYILSLDTNESKTDHDLSLFIARLQSSHICSSAASPNELVLSIATDLHNWLLSSVIDKGMTALTGDYRMRVQNFVAEYIGNRERIVPFGGRNVELAQLHKWLDQRAASPFMLISATAGRGKSALLVEWAKQLQSQVEIAVLFFPISIRFRTNLSGVVFCSIATYLSNLHGERLSIAADSPPDVWRGLMLDYLIRPLPDGRQLVVIIDGLDEAADWRAGPNLFPVQIAGNSKVIVSARQLAGDSGPDNWLRRLGWDSVAGACSMQLPLLAESAVSDILLCTGVPLDEIAENPTLVAELHRLSEGDPLLVRLYVSELWSRGEAARHLTIDDLREIEPGFEGFLNRWWEDQKSLWQDEHPLREKSVQAIASALACAFGPLTRDDLFALLGEDSDLSTWGFEDALEPLKRFIVGDGEQHGYVFSHPRLAVYFKERLSTAERSRFSKKFIVWGETMITSLNRGEIHPQDTSQYLLEYLAAHLVDSSLSEDHFAILVTDGWRKARYIHEGTYAGFVSDLDIIVRMIRESNSIPNTKPENSSLFIKCITCISSIDQISRSTPPQFVIAAIRSKLWPVAAAAVYAKMIDEPLHRAKVFAYLADVSSGDKRMRMLDETTEALNRVVNNESNLIMVPSFEESSYIETEYLKIFGEIVRLLPEQSLTCSLSLMTPLSKSGKKTAMFCVIAYASNDLFYAMLDACTSIVDEADQHECLRALGNQYSNQVFNIAVNHNHERITSWQFIWLLLGAVDVLEHGRCTYLLEIAAETSRKIADSHIRTNTLVEVSTHPKNSDVKLFKESVLISTRVPYAYRRAKLLIQLAISTQGRSSVKLAEKALSSIEKINAESFQTIVLLEFAPLVSNENATRIMCLLERISDEQLLTESVAKLLEYLPAEYHILAFDLIKSIDKFTLLSEFVNAPKYVPLEWISSIGELYLDEQLTQEWIYTLLSSFAPILDINRKITLIEQINSFPDYDFAALVAIAALGAYADTNDKKIDSLFESILSAYLTCNSHQQLHYLEEVFKHASTSLLKQVAVLIEKEDFSVCTSTASLLAPYLNTDQIQQWIRSFQTINDLDSCRSYYVQCLEQLGGGNTRSKYEEIWHLLDPADQLYLLLQNTEIQNSQIPVKLDELLELTNKIKDYERKAFLYLNVLKKLDLDMESVHWPKLLNIGLMIAESTDSNYAAEAFHFILKRIPEELMEKQFNQLFKWAVKYRSQYLRRLSQTVPSQTINNAFQKFDKEGQLYLVLNTDLPLDFDMETFIEQIDEHDSSAMAALIIAVLKRADSQDYKIPWSKLIAVAVAINKTDLDQKTIETIIMDAPKQCVSKEFNGLFTILRHFQPKPDVVSSLLQKVSSQDIAEAVVKHWATELQEYASQYFMGSVDGPNLNLTALSEWALLAAGDDVELLFTRLANLLAELSELGRTKFLNDWGGSPEFGPYFVEYCCDFEDPKLKAIALVRLMSQANTAQVPKILDWIIEFINEDLSRAELTFKGKLDSGLEWLICNSGIKIAVLIEMVATTTGPGQQHIAMYALRVLRSINNEHIRTTAAKILWEYVPESIRALLTVSILNMDFSNSELVKIQRSQEIHEPYSVIIDSSISETFNFSDTNDTNFIWEAFEARVMPKAWIQNIEDLHASEGVVILSNIIDKALTEYPDASDIGWIFWQRLILMSAHRGRSYLLETLIALLPVTRKLFGDDAIRDQMLAVQECANWWR